MITVDAVVAAMVTVAGVVMMVISRGNNAFRTQILKRWQDGKSKILKLIITKS